MAKEFDISSWFDLKKYEQFGDLDTSWFDLKHYEKLGELDLCGWYQQLRLRNFTMHYSMLDNDDWVALWHQTIKTKPIIDNYDDDWGGWRKSYSILSSNTSSVFGTPALDYWNIVQDSRLNDVWDACELSSTFDATDEQESLANMPIDLLYQQRGVIHIGDCASITIDLAATNEQIMNDFSHWLIEYRKIKGCNSNEKILTDKDLSGWVRHRVLPYIDLTLVANIEKKELKPINAARLLFPELKDSTIELTPKLQRTTKPKAQWLLRDETIETISAQLRASA